MELINIKKFVLACCKPLLVSVKQYIDSKLAYIDDVTKNQNSSISSMQSEVANLSGQVAKLSEEIVRYRDEVSELKSSHYTKEQIETLITRVTSLDRICGILYDKVYELIHTGEVTDPTLPDFENPDFGDKEEEIPTPPEDTDIQE